MRVRQEEEGSLERVSQEEEGSHEGQARGHHSHPHSPGTGGSGEPSPLGYALLPCQTQSRPPLEGVVRGVSQTQSRW